jgi:molybdopterin-containing oxidoreductase family membrane subunit
MLEKALSGGRGYWTWIFTLLLLISLGFIAYLHQFNNGLTITGLSRDVPWGFYIAQFTFLVGVAASAVVLVLPYYLHDFKAFGKLVVLGEFLAIAAVIMCMLFIFVDMGQPMRVVNVMLFPTPHSLMFWDMTVLCGYLLLNVLISRVTFRAEIQGIPPNAWIRPVIILSVPWAISIHTVTAFLYSGLAARPFWESAVLAPRFLASAFSAGPAILIMLALLLARISAFDVGFKALNRLSIIMLYAMLANLFFIAMEFFTVFYSDIPEHTHHFRYLFFGLDGATRLVPWMWFSLLLGIGCATGLLVPRLRHQRQSLAFLSAGIVLAIWIDKGLGMVVGGFVPSPLGIVTEYWPTLPEVGISAGIYAIGALILTGLYKIALSERGLTGATRSKG